MSDLKAFLQAQLAQQAAGRSVDWTKRKEKWIAELNRLFTWVKSTLVTAGFEANSISDVAHLVSEERLGPYSAPGIRIKLPTGVSINFKPVGSVVIGGYGRVDVSGDNSERVKLIADDADEDRADNDETPSYDRDWAWRVHPGVGLTKSFALDETGLARLLSILAR